jgi:hypothetical protein
VIRRNDHLTGNALPERAPSTTSTSALSICSKTARLTG